MSPRPCQKGRMPPENSRMKQIRRGVSPGSVSTSTIGPGPPNREYETSGRKLLWLRDQQRLVFL